MSQLAAAIVVCAALLGAAYTGWRVYFWKRSHEEHLTELAHYSAQLADLRTALAGGKLLPNAQVASVLQQLIEPNTVAYLLSTGVTLRPLLTALDTTLRNQRENLQHIWTQLAGIRATTLLLTQLPVLGILLGYMVGAHPLTFLTHGWGSVVLLAGIACQCAGVWWIGRMVRTIQIPDNHQSAQLEVHAALLSAGLPIIQLETPLQSLLPERHQDLLRTALREGAPLAALLQDLAHDLQSEALHTCQQQIEEIGVLLARPLGMCFLPGFLLIGMLPTVLELGGAFMGIT